MSSLRANSLTIEYDEFGDRSAPAILLIMGLGTQMTAWPESFCRGLAGRGFRVIRFDNRDVGLSEKFDGAKVPGLVRWRLMHMLGIKLRPPYTLADMADDAAGVLDSLSIARAHLVGISMGGMIAQIMAATRPDRVRSLTSLASTSGAPGLPGPDVELARHMFSRPRKATREYLIDHTVKTWRMIGSPAFPVSDEERHRKASEALDRSFYPEGYRRHLAAILGSAGRTGLLSRIEAPTLVIHGDSDRLIPPECGRDTARRIPGSQLEIIAGLGHDLPESFMPQLTALVAGHAEAADRRDESSRATATPAIPADPVIEGSSGPV